MSRPSSLFSPIPIWTPYGFACKIWVAYQLEKHYLGGLYYVWFARELNPIENGDSSNPLTIYETVDRAVKKRDINHPKPKDFKAGFLDVVNRLIVPRDAALARSVRREILRAPVEMFRPQLWRIDLSTIPAPRIRTDRSASGWDDQYISDLAETEFEIIVE
jgi:hypothetical protein